MKQFPIPQDVKALQRSSGRGRLDGVDAARGLALVGMLAVHFGPEDAEGWLGRLYSLPHGRASILFVVVAGVGMALLSGTPAKHAEARLRLVLFALVLLPLGLTLQMLHHEVAVILQHYSAMFLLGAAALGLSRRQLLLLAGACALLGPLLYFVVGAAFPAILDGYPTRWGQPGWYLPLALIVAGPYPLLSWAAPVLLGLWIGRQPLHIPSIQRRLLVGGIIVAALALLLSHLLIDLVGEPRSPGDPRNLLVMYAHSEMPLWLIQAAAAASAILGGCLILARKIDLLTVPFAALGRFALTGYVAHLVALHVGERLLRHEEVPHAMLSVIAFSAALSVFAVMWERRYERGPVEYVLHAFWHFVRMTLPRAGGQEIHKRPMDHPRAEVVSLDNR